MSKGLKAVPPPARSPSRMALAAAIAERDRLVEVEKERLIALNAAAENLKTIDARHVHAAAAVAETKEAAAARLVAAARGNVSPAPDQALVQARIEAVAAKDELEAAIAAYGVVKADMDAAIAEREAADRAVEIAADAVVTDEAVAIMARSIEEARELERRSTLLRVGVRWLLVRRRDTYGFNPQLANATAGDADAVRFLGDRDNLPARPPIFGLSSSGDSIDWESSELNEPWKEWRRKLSTLPDALPPTPED
jgi:hypothetical protein